MFHRVSVRPFPKAGPCYGQCVWRVAGGGLVSGADAVRVDIPEHAAQHDDETKHGEIY